eukprot:CAMPEP_0183492666 /NCGR_PEP_ID=MMETSP0370-20130417/183061_1 /TAXON_ID=268820 /ORGANISM="Peridinium aciculiferum, Strain PAER-2" /LENGTH=344 /DNA_ID=CAMNT_0025686007 /DNA_START=30 /DNA_END=1065 /DNA_ORIENTATION=+
MNKSAVVEQYLKARWRVLAPETPVLQDASAIASMRIAIMSQSDLSVVDLFRSLPAMDRQTLSVEMARTGCPNQRYSTTPSIGGGPAFLIYYGPALLQKNVDSPRCFRAALRTLAEVMRVARVMWPLSKGPEAEGSVVTILVAELKTQTIDIVLGIARSEEEGRWVLVRHNDREGAVEFRKDVPDVQLDVDPRMEALNFLHCIHIHSADESEDPHATTQSLEDNYASDGSSPAARVFQAVEFRKDVPDVQLDVDPRMEAREQGEGFPEPFVEKTTSRRTSKLPFAAEDEEGLESTVESGLAASLRQENWLLRDQVASLGDEVARLRMRLASLDCVEGTASNPPGD